MYVTKQAFALQMQYIARYYRVIDAEELFRALRNGEKLPTNACVLTFDDGWVDTYRCALPVLKQHNFPAIVFLVSEYVGTQRWFWPEKIMLLVSRYLLSGGAEASWASTCETLVRTGVERVLVAPRLSPTQKIHAVIESLKAIAPHDRDLAIRELEGVLAVHGVEFAYSERLIMNWDEVVEMSKHRIAFGAHTKTHAILTQIPAPEAAAEIADSKIPIEEHLGAACTFFCYPNGNYNTEIKERVMAHYGGAFTVRQGFVQSGDDPFLLKRIGMREAASFTRALFACKASGLHNLLVGAMRKICKFS
jgi:peptidoglycan/xylan/chitin deacetylase (PgdA/CDA1 family)